MLWNSFNVFFPLSALSCAVFSSLDAANRTHIHGYIPQHISAVPPGTQANACGPKQLSAPERSLLRVQQEANCETPKGDVLFLLHKMIQRLILLLENNLFYTLMKMTFLKVVMTSTL